MTITLATFRTRAAAAGWNQVEVKHHGQGVISVVFQQESITMSGTFFPVSLSFPESGFCVTLVDQDTSNFVAMAYYEDHTDTTFSFEWALSNLMPKYVNSADDQYADPFEHCDCGMCRPDLFENDYDSTYEPLHPYEDYDPELARP